MGRVEGKVIIVTGAASGLGAADSKLLVREGAQVVMTDINEKAGKALADSLGSAATFVYHDVRDESQWISLIDKTMARFGRLDVLVNNAGVVVFESVETTTPEQWRFVNSVSSDGTYLGCKYAIPAMRKTGGGSIINISSVAAIGGYPLVFAYSAAKGAIRGMTKSIAVHCAQNRYNIRCNSVHPGTIDTPMVADALKALNTDPANYNVGLGKPDDIAYMVLYLASDESRFVNGSEFIIDNTATITEGTIPH
jgi:3(or 17)beta-hydroxysteroid dehydrogenase